MSRKLIVAFLILAITCVSGVAFAQKNLNCFNPAMPPMDVIAACNQNLANDSKDAQVYQARGAAWYRTGDYDRAIADYTQSINIDPKYIRAFFNRGLAWEKKGNLDNALTDFKYFADLDPSFPDVQKAIARVRSSKKKIESVAIKPQKIINPVVQPVEGPSVSSPSSAVSPTAQPTNDTIATPAAVPPPKELTAKPATAPSTQPPTANTASSIATPIAETRVALVIGNSAYDKVPLLPNPVNDANDISESLKQLGFSVQTLTNANFEQMRRKIIAFGRDVQGSDIAVVFFAGHGMEIGGENWLIPVDAELLSDTDAESEAISLKTVMLQVTKAAKLGLVILDACRNNPFAAKMQRTVRVRSVDRGFARTEPLDNVLVAYSAKDGTTARDGSGRNSPFTSALIKHIQTPGLEIRFLFANVRDDVMAATKREQQPFVYGSLSSERIYFRMPDGTKPSETTKPIATPKLGAKPSPVAVVPAEGLRSLDLLQVVSFAVTGSYGGRVVAVDRAKCIFRVKSNTYYLSNIYTDRISFQNSLGHVSVGLHGKQKVADIANVDVKEPAELPKELNEYYREVYEANSTSYTDYKLQIDTDESARLTKAWQYIYANGCKGMTSPF
jgi:tetratricopeptide (TPR) repeat protein